MLIPINIDIRRRPSYGRTVHKVVHAHAVSRFPDYISVHINNTPASLPATTHIAPKPRSGWAAVFGKTFTATAGSLLLILMVGLIAYGLVSIGNTVAFYNDSESSSGNISTAGFVDFTVLIEKPEGPAGGLVPGSSTTQFATVVSTSTLGFKYTVKVEKTGGDDDFCNALTLEAKLEGLPNYMGNLLTFVSLPVVYSEATDNWEFIISLPSDVSAQGSCSFDFVFSGWQSLFVDISGFSDIERVDDPVHSAVSLEAVSDGAHGTVEFVASTTENQNRVTTVNNIDKENLKTSSTLDTGVTEFGAPDNNATTSDVVIVTVEITHSTAETSTVETSAPEAVIPSSTPLYEGGPRAAVIEPPQPIEVPTIETPI